MVEKVFVQNLSLIYKPAAKYSTVGIFLRKADFLKLRSLEILHLGCPLEFFNALFDFSSGGTLATFHTHKVCLAKNFAAAFCD